MRQANHQEHGTDHTPGDNGAGQPGPLIRRQGRRPGPTQQAVQPQADAGAEIEQARQHPWIDVAQQPFGQRCSGAKQKRCTQGGKHA